MIILERRHEKVKNMDFEFRHPKNSYICIFILHFFFLPIWCSFKRSNLECILKNRIFYTIWGKVDFSWQCRKIESFLWLNRLTIDSQFHFTQINYTNFNQSKTGIRKVLSFCSLIFTLYLWKRDFYDKFLLHCGKHLFQNNSENNQ